MKTHLNTLFVTLEGAYLRKDGEAVEVRHDGQTRLRVPLHNLDGIVCFGYDTVASAILMSGCAQAGVSLSFHTPQGKFLACSNGFTPGNILLRREQYRRADSENTSLVIARNMVAAKIANSRNILQRASRDHGDKDATRAFELSRAVDFLDRRIGYASRAVSLGELRGVEGDSASAYFAAFPRLFTNHDPAITFDGRSRRPPRDPANALISFLYSLLMHDCRSALESCGLDPQCGFLHRDRPGRPSLALDLMEEFRAFLADRTALSLFNRRQILSSDFRTEDAGGVFLRDDARKTVLTAWQERKSDEVIHPFLEEKMTVGLLPHIQARLLARHVRGDLDAYPPFLVK
ncbi:MAG: type I-C CRISPR-associated endonuclease Cas1c [Terrimicrobiaceae bacterium]